VQQVLDRFEQRQIRFGSGQPFRRSPAGDDGPMRADLELGQEVLDQDRFSHPRLAGDRRKRALAADGPDERFAQRPPLRFTADGRAPHAEAGGGRIERRRTPGDHRELTLDVVGGGPMPAVLRQHAQHQRLQRRRNPRVEPARRGRVLRHDRRHHREARGPGKRPAARHQLVEHGAEREHVRRLVERLALGLLRRHVRCGAEDGPWRRLDVRRRGGLLRLIDRQHPCQAEVEHLDVAVRAHHHVLRLDVAVYDAGGVRAREGQGDLTGDLGDHLQRDALLHHRPERAAVHQLLNDVVIAGRRSPRFVNGDDVGVIEGGRGARLAKEPLDGGRPSGAAGRQNLDRDLAAQASVDPSIDFTHAAAPEQRVDPVVPDLRAHHVGQSRRQKSSRTLTCVIFMLPRKSPTPGVFFSSSVCGSGLSGAICCTIGRAS
jgi:hypothetical protein